MAATVFFERPPRPRSRSTVAAAVPQFAQRPVRAPQEVERAPSPPFVQTESLPPPRPLTLGEPPKELNLPPHLPPELSRASRSSSPRRLSQFTSSLPPLGRARIGRRSLSEAPPPLPTCVEEGTEDLGFARAPLIRNVATFEKPKEYSRALSGIPALQRPVVQAASSNRSARRVMRSPIDDAIQREFIGDGIALEDAVDARRGAGWAVKHRHLQRSDVGHCCHACRHPLRDMNEEVVVWTGAAIYRRFHPQCAASYMLKADAEKKLGTASGSHAMPPPDVVEGYADGWRVPRDDPSMGAGRPRPVEAARQWLLSQNPAAFSALRGDLFTTVTITENGKKKAVPGLSHQQLHVLETKHKWRSPNGVDESAGDPADDGSERLECPICFAGLDPRGPSCVRLPCAPQHVCHVDCVWPWLRKASICPVCRKDLRPLLTEARGSSR